MSIQPHGKTVQYTGKVRTVGGRDGGGSRSEDGRLSVIHTVPGKPGNGANPEQLLAAGWSACFQSAMELAAKKMKIVIPADAAVNAEVDLYLGDDGYALQARFNFSLPGLSIDLAQALVDSAHYTCPYSRAFRGSIPVEFSLI